MSNGNGFEFELSEKYNDKTITVRFRDSSYTMRALDELSRIKSEYELRSTRTRIRSICVLSHDDVYIPRGDVSLPKARWLTVSAAASYPNGVPIDTIVQHSELTEAEISAYCTSKNNPTSEYLETRDENIEITPSGMEWVLGLLEKDNQLEKVD